MKLFILTALISINLFAQIVDSLHLNKTVTDSLYNSDTTLIAPGDLSGTLNISQLDANNFFISHESLIKSKYRFAGDLLSYFPFSFQRDYGFIGYPNEILLYGIGKPFVNWMSDGISLNDRFANSFNLNLIQTEDIDSIEIVPLTRGFLYGNYMYPVTVNFITRDFIPNQPYSRIRYIQGPNREASVDANFHALVAKDFLFSFDITNRIKDSTFRNTEFSIWQIKTRLKYFLSDKMNLIASYNYNDYKTGFNGGVDVDSIALITSDINSVLYDNFLAPVNLPYDELKIFQHFQKLSLVTNFFEWLKSDVNLYYRFTRNTEPDLFFNLREEKVLGLSLRNQINVKNIELNTFLDFENEKQMARIRDEIILLPFETRFLSDEINVLSIGALLTTKLLSDKLNLSLFYKYSGLNKNYGRNISVSEPDSILSGFRYSANLNNSGFGFDLSFRINDNLKIYVGGSYLDQYSTTSTNSQPLLFQSGLNFANDFLNMNLYYVYNEYLINSVTNYHYLNQADKVSGLALLLKTKYKFILLESQNALYKTPSGSELYFVPALSSRTGLYYNDFLFDKNLDLKAGFIFSFIGEQNYSSVETSIISVPSVSRLDFSLAGEIRKTAIVYFIIENISDKKYYITPYYPMPERNFRFGIAWELLN